jgi:hypothetical protein
MSIAAGMIAVASHIVWAFLFYELFKPVNRGISLLAMVVAVVGIAVQAFSVVLQFAPLLILDNSERFGAFTLEQLQVLSLMFLRFRAQAFNVYIAFFGLWCVVTGYLVFNSNFMPRIIGVLEVVSGLCWLTFFWPPLADALFRTITGPLSAPGELSLQLWLIVFGINVQRWREQARFAGASAPA